MLTIKMLIKIGQLETRVLFTFSVIFIVWADQMNIRNFIYLCLWG